MRRRLLTLAVLLAACAPGPQQQRPGRVEHLELENWREFRGPAFTLLSNSEPELARRMTGQLAAFAEVVERTSPRARPRGIPATVLLFRSYAQFLTFSYPGIAGFMSAGLDEDLLVSSSQSVTGRTPVLFHEYVHLLLQGDLAFPAWYHEGFAELLSTTTIREDLATLGGVPLERRRALEGGPRVRIEELLGARYSLDLGRRTPGFYAESWLLAHYLHVGPAYGAPRRLQQARDLLLLQNRGIGWQPAFERAFTGISIDGLQRELDLHRRRILEGSDLPVIDLALASLPKRFEESKLPTESAALRLGGLALRLGPTFVRVAEALFQTALGLAPGDPAALVGLARCAAQHGDFEAAEAKLELALRAGRDTGLIELARGEILMERYGRSLQVEEGSGPDPALPMEARSALLHATELLPSLPAAWAALGANYAADPSSDPTPGIHALERARESVGAHPGVELQLGTLYARKGETERARLLLSRVAVLALDDELAGKAQLELERLSPR